MSQTELTNEEKGLIKDAVREWVNRYDRNNPFGRLARLRDSIDAKIPYVSPVEKIIVVRHE